MSFVCFRRKIITKQENARDRQAISGQLKQFSHLLLFDILQAEGRSKLQYVEQCRSAEVIIYCNYQPEGKVLTFSWKITVQLVALNDHGMRAHSCSSSRCGSKEIAV